MSWRPKGIFNFSKSHENNITVTSMSELTPSQEQAIKLLDSGLNVFLTGKAGTGKSYLVDHFVDKHPEKSIIKCAPTGVAALKIGGATIHRTFGVPVRLLGHNDICTLSEKLEILEKADVILIDEISMCRIDVFEYVMRTLKKVFSESGSKQIVLVGDFYQLPPVLNEEREGETFHKLYGDRLYAFESSMWNGSNFLTVELTEVKRQKEGRLLSSLSNIREGIPDFSIFHRPDCADDDAVSLCPTNKMAKQINEKHLKQLDNLTTFRATITGDISDEDMATDKYLTLAIGARIIMLVNDPNERWVNGSLGTITSLDEDYITVRIDNKGVYQVEPYTWSIIEYELEEDIKTHEKHIVEKEIGTFTQFPMKLAWAITIHKSQGQTYDKVNIFNGFFANGQMYVALSRCKTLDGIHVMGKLVQSQLKCSWAVNKFMKTSIKESNFKIDLLLEQIRKDKINKIGCYVNEAKSLETLTNKILTQINDTKGQFTQDNASNAIQPFVNSIRNDSNTATKCNEKGMQLLQTVKQLSDGFEREGEIINLLNEMTDVLNQIKLEYEQIRKAVSESERTLKNVQQKEEQIRRQEEMRERQRREEERRKREEEERILRIENAKATRRKIITAAIIITILVIIIKMVNK